MKCPACGYVSFDLLETCKHCGAPMAATAAVPSPAALPDASALEVGNDDLDAPLIAGQAAVESDDGGPSFRIDDDLFGESVPGVAAAVPVVPEWADPGGSWLATAADLPGPAFALPGEESIVEVGGEPIIDRDDEVPDRYWAPAAAGFGRRVSALLVDQAVLVILLGTFFLGAFITLKLNGFDTDYFLATAGLHAALPPFALLGALLSFTYNVFFHGFAGRTPGKALAGIEVRAGDGGALSWSRVTLRWLGSAIGLACAGAGIFWAIFEPRRRGWADLVSGTVIARAGRESAATVPRR